MQKVLCSASEDTGVQGPQRGGDIWDMPGGAGDLRSGVPPKSSACAQVGISPTPMKR